MNCHMPSLPRKSRLRCDGDRGRSSRSRLRSRSFEEWIAGVEAREMSRLRGSLAEQADTAELEGAWAKVYEASLALLRTGEPSWDLLARASHALAIAKNPRVAKLFAQRASEEFFSLTSFGGS